MRVSRVLAAAAIGFLMVTAGTAVLLRLEDSENSLLWLAGAYVIGLPLVGWPLLHLAGIRPSFLGAVLGPCLLFVAIATFKVPHGTWVPARLGLLGAPAYAVGVLLLRPYPRSDHGG